VPLGGNVMDAMEEEEPQRIEVIKPELLVDEII